ncbi:hypothetical protein AWL63_23685 (plasmid) [Sphingomonas panacis]|uniref:Uncharacterized protein n=1 Tax=Sphingomonas panacis TaxID=1560345 RepID=A0A1B3ZIB4_9SPHN|nr:hypothetical protein [Sphingomonas panacis]AOH87172.1 hypothetical protein AWL63_23685 [Sphingomonas panacis]
MISRAVLSRLPIADRLQDDMGQALAGIHSLLSFVLTLSVDEAARHAALEETPAVAFRIPHRAAWLLVDRTSASIAGSNSLHLPEKPYAALSLSPTIVRAIQTSPSWAKGSALAERAVYGLLVSDRAAFQKLLAYAPLIETQVYAFAARLVEILDALRGHLLTSPQTGERRATLTQHYWRFAGMLGQATLVATTPGARPWLVDLAKAFTWTTWTPSFPFVRDRNCWLAAIGARAAAEFGPAVIPGYADALDRSEHPLTAADAMMALVAIALQHDAAREEVIGLIRGSTSHRPGRIAPELWPLLAEQAENVFLETGPATVPHRFRLPSYQVDPTGFDPREGYPLFRQLRSVLGASIATFIPGSGAAPVLPTGADAEAMFIRAWGPEQKLERPENSASILH